MISYIIAAYNESKNISACVDNVLENFIEGGEIIIVDDGSTDDTWEICQRLTQKYREVKAYHQTNTGVSGARNHGLRMATKKWITFVDADDRVVNQGLEKMLQKAEEVNADLIIGAQTVNGENREVNEMYELREGNTLQIYALNKSKYSKCMLGKIHGCYGKLYKTELAKAVGFIDGLGLGEDLLFVMGVLERAKKIATTNIVCYSIYENAMSATRRMNKDMIEYAVKFIKETQILEMERRDSVYFEELNYQRFHHFDVGVGGFLAHRENRIAFAERLMICKEVGRECGIEEICRNVNLNSKSLSAYEKKAVLSLSEGNYSGFLLYRIFFGKMKSIKSSIGDFLKRRK